MDSQIKIEMTSRKAFPTFFATFHTRFKKILRKAAGKGGELVWDILKDMASETATKIILGR